MRRFWHSSLLTIGLLSILAPVPFADATDGAAPHIGGLLELRNIVRTAAGLPISVDKLQEISGRFANFYSAHRETLGRPENRRALQEYLKLRNYISVRAKFEKCLRNFDNRSGLGRRVLDLAFALNPEQIHCDDTASASIVDQVRAMDSAISSSLLTGLQRGLTLQIRENAATNLADMMIRVNEANSSDRDIARRVASTTCNSGCDSQTRAALERAATRHIERRRAEGVRSRGFAETTASLNGRLRDLNRHFRLPQASEGAARAAFAQYESDYWALASQGEGLLLFTPELQRRGGQVVRDPGVRRNGGAVRLNSDGHTRELQVQEVRSAYQQFISDQAQMSVSLSARARATTDQGRRDTLKQLVKGYPLAAAQIIMNEPTYAGAICDLINEAEAETDATRESQENRSIWTMAAGGALVVAGIGVYATGVGAIIGIPATLALAGAGTALTGTEVALSAMDYRRAQAELQQIERGQRSGSTDAASLREAQRLSDEMADAVFDASLTLGLSAAGSSTFIAGVREAARLGAGTNLAQNVVRATNRFGEDGVVRFATQVLGDREGGQFMGRIMALPERMQENTLRLLNEVTAGGTNPTAVRQFAQALTDSLCG